MDAGNSNSTNSLEQLHALASCKSIPRQSRLEKQLVSSTFTSDANLKVIRLGPFFWLLNPATELVASILLRASGSQYEAQSF